jgi:hypothetical protein
VTVERWAQQIIQKELNHPVVIHDDGSQPSMYDLRIGAVEAPDVAIECVGAVDSVFTETWNVGPGKGSFSLAVKGDWRIGIARKARIRTIKRRIEPILQDLEEQEISEVRVGHFLKRDDSGLLEKTKVSRHSARLVLPHAGNWSSSYVDGGSWWWC